MSFFRKQGYFHNGKATGSETTVDGLPAYVSGAADAPAAILIVTDVYVSEKKLSAAPLNDRSLN
jgi:hypothetical protein